MNILLIDNYDSFTYNLVQYFKILNCHVDIRRNNAITLDEITCLAPDAIVISPGPNSPVHAGISLDIIKHFHQSLPILGVCLGHQCIAYAFGGKIINSDKIVHGKTSPVYHNNKRLFKKIPSPFNATRYHSLIVERQSLPSCFNIDACSDDLIMAISHKKFPLFGIQFHPEAILTENGLDIIENFLNISMELTHLMR